MPDQVKLQTRQERDDKCNNAFFPLAGGGGIKTIRHKTQQFISGYSDIYQSLYGYHIHILYTVKNGYFGKILTLHRKTAKLPICFSDSFLVIDTNIYCLVTNRDLHCVYGCCNPSADWNVPQSRQFSESSSFVPSQFSSVSHEKEGDESFSGGGGGYTGNKKKSKFNVISLYPILYYFLCKNTSMLN